MLDTEPTGGDADKTRDPATTPNDDLDPAGTTGTGTQTAGAGAAEAAPPARTRRRRATAAATTAGTPEPSVPGAPAGTPVTDAPSSASAGAPDALVADAPAVKAPRKRAPRKAVAKVEVEATAAGVTDVLPAEATAVAPPVDATVPVAPAPAKRARSRRTTAAAADATAGPTDAGAVTPAGTVAGPDAATSAVTPAGTAAPASGSPPAGVGASPAPVGGSLITAPAAEAPSPVADTPPVAKRTRSRRAAAAPAGPPPVAGPTAPAAGSTARTAETTAPAAGTTVPAPTGASDVPPDVAAPADSPAGTTAPPARRRRSRAAAKTAEPALPTPDAGAAPPAPAAAGTDDPDAAGTAAPVTAGTAGPDAVPTPGSAASGASGTTPFGTGATGTEDVEPPVTAAPMGTATPFADAGPEVSRRTRRRATAPETTPPPAPPVVMFVAPTEVEAPASRRRSRAAEPDGTVPADRPARRRRGAAADDVPETAQPEAAERQTDRRRRATAAPEAVKPTGTPDAAEPTEEAAAPSRRRRRSRGADSADAPETAEAAGTGAVDSAATDLDDEDQPTDEATGTEDDTDEDAGADRRRRRRGRRGRGRSRLNGEGDTEDTEDDATGTAETEDEATDEAGEEDRPSSRRRRRRRRRGNGGADVEETADDDPPDTVVHVREAAGKKERERSSEDEVRGVRGSTRLEAKRQRRREGRDTGRRRPPILTESEFLARREAVDRVMVVRQRGDRTQIAVLEDDILVEHYVTKASSSSYAGNVYLGRVQNVLPSMEAAFVDIGKGRNAVLYAGEVNWDVAGLEGRARSIEHALKSGDSIVVQVTKDPIGHKGARLTSQISLPGRYLVYVPNGSMTGISRKLPDTERARLKDILRRIVPDDAGVIIRTAAEGASEEELTRDVQRLQAQWEAIQQKAGQTKSAPTLLYAEPDLELRVVRDVFNEDFTKLVVSGDDAWDMINQYVDHVAPDLLPRLSRYTGEGDAFSDLRIDEQLLKGLDRKVYLPSGGSLVIDRTEAMTVIDVNTGKFVGQGGNLEQTVTRNNLEAAEEIVRQLRLRDIGGIIVIDFIDMVLESNRDLVLRRLTECLGRDRTKHQVAEVTSLGLVQMTRKRVGQGLLEAFSEPCPHCNGRGVLVHTEPVDDSRKKQQSEPATGNAAGGSGRSRRGRRSAAADAGPPAVPTPALLASSRPADPADVASPEEVDVASEDHRPADEAIDTVVAVEPEAEVTVRPAEAAPGGAEVTLDVTVPARGGGPGVSEIAGSEPGPTTAEADRPPAAPVPTGPVAGSNGVVMTATATDNGADSTAAAGPADAEIGTGTGNGQAPRRRRRAASRPAGPPQPAHSE